MRRRNNIELGCDISLLLQVQNMHEKGNKLNELMLGFEEYISVFTMFLIVAY
jgi:hypothetical protein